MPAPKSSVVAKPTYAVMVTEGIKALGDRTGSSMQAISKYLVANYKTDVNKTALSRAIKKGVESGDFVQIKASYKLGKKPVKAPKPATKKKVAKPRKTSTKTSKKAVTKSTKSKVTSKSSVAKKLKPKKVIAKKTSSLKKKSSSKSSGKKSATSAKKKSK